MPKGHTSTIASVRLRLCMITLFSLSLLSLTGCTQILLLGYLIGGPPSIEPEFDKETGISLDKKERKVLVLCYAPKEVKWDFDSIDRELGRHVSHRLNQNKIKVIDPDAVQAWLDEHADDWDQPGEIGKEFEVDFVVFMEVSKFTLYEPGNSNLFRGESETLLKVYEMEDGEGKEIYSKEVNSKYPIHQPVSTSDYSYYDFKRLYLSSLSEEIGRHFYEHYAGDDIGNGVL